MPIVEFITTRAGEPTLHRYERDGMEFVWAIGGTGERYLGEFEHDAWYVFPLGMPATRRVTDPPFTVNIEEHKDYRRIRLERGVVSS